MNNKPPCYSFAVTRAMLVGVLASMSFLAGTAPKKITRIYPAPAGTILSRRFRVAADGKDVPAYEVKVSAGDLQRRLNAIDDAVRTDGYFDRAAFAYFDLQGESVVTVTAAETVKSVKILPASAGITGRVRGRTISFTASQPQNLTVEINGDIIGSLHVFVNPIEAHVPSPRDTNVIYFGPGVHRVSHMVIGDNKTVYIAGGAVVKAVIDPKEPFDIEPSGLRNYSPTFQLRGKNIRFLGHGVIDASECSNHARNMINVRGSQIRIDGPILVNSSGWTVPLRQCQNVAISNLKLLGYRANSDGIDICNSRDVTVCECFVRTGDDLIVVKTELGEGESQNITVTKCVLWNQAANALSIGAELRHDVRDVTFSDCDVIHDIGRAWSMHIFQADASVISDILFDNIRVEDAHQLINLWIGKSRPESHDLQFGHIRNVTFSNIEAKGAPLNVDLVGASAQGQIENVQFINVRLNGEPLSDNTVKRNPFVRGTNVIR